MQELSISQKQQLLNQLLPMISDHKNELFTQIIQNRMRHLTVVVEDIYQSQNASAVLRSADCFGIQDVHIIENKNEYTINPEVALGSSKWLSLYKYNSEENNTKAAFAALRSKGYKIVATTPHKDDTMLEDLDINDKVALVFGTELEGLSDYAIANADVHMKIPMYGFTESYNISVSAALCLHHLSDKIRRSDIDWKLHEQEKIEVLLDWARSVVKSGAEVERFMFSNSK
ncbi:MAG: TrmH family RNA methyltransferase [Bacteroidales bacterium]|nr:TrmH family RNA methyltransferase [Bacteroidales bacterium]